MPLNSFSSILPSVEKQERTAFESTSQYVLSSSCDHFTEVHITHLCTMRQMGIACTVFHEHRLADQRHSHCKSMNFT
ncbi:hypothetical protein Y032_0101g3407 [Ancylostoma ceylanicum]|uniref:Uncharacterized protein n=1 Tax=Ancylostoma ceylanicum TaxID=53326 RepID=A0A016THW3_9BILA|nr:hypothetical protein Y032_0101g3407 [Ancylostoma ceylanicum]